MRRLWIHPPITVLVDSCLFLSKKFPCQIFSKTILQFIIMYKRTVFTICVNLIDLSSMKMKLDVSFPLVSCSWNRRIPMQKTPHCPRNFCCFWTWWTFCSVSVCLLWLHLRTRKIFNFRFVGGSEFHRLDFPEL